MGPSFGLVWHLDAPLPESLTVARGNVLYLTGRCYHRERPLRALAVLVDGLAHPVANHSQIRPDVPSEDPAVGDTIAYSLTSGFWLALPFERADVERVVQLAWRAVLDDGREYEAAMGSLRLLPGGPGERATTEATGEPRVAVCMATYNPDPRFLAEQIQSLVDQQHRNWVCIVSDDASAPDRMRDIEAATARDPRFHLVRHAVRLGYYGNFERALALVPPDAAFVALADHDDVWYAEKLRALLAAFRADTALVYGDMDVVTRDCAPIASTYWTTRRNNYTDLASLVFANTVTGAASMFRASLLADLLPFPPRIGEAYHDHWIACTALAKGEIRYVDRPLHAYRQHEANVLGHFAPPPHRMLPRPGEVVRALGRAQLGRRLMTELWRRREVYGADVVRLIVVARLLLLRLGATMAPEKRATLERVAALEHAPIGLVREVIAALLERRPTLGAEWHCLRGTVAARLLDRYYSQNRERLFAERVTRRSLTGAGIATSATAAIDLIEDKTAPLRLRCAVEQPRRVNLISPAIDFEHLFAGYLGKLNLALRLRDAGHAVRLVIVDRGNHDPARWRRAITGYPGLEAFFDRVEVFYAGERDTPLDVHPRDAFIATTWWTAHIAHRAVRELGRARFVYLIQEFEPMTFPMGSFHALAAESYTVPHRAVFSTELLRDFFREQRLGVYAAGRDSGDAASLSFQNAITAFEVTADRLARTGPRKLLFYARPEQHAARNMFELGVLALRQCVADGALGSAAWIVDGVGAGRAFQPIALGGGCRLSLLPRVDLAEYRTLLPSYDVGLSLRLTPHPSLVPLEMAAAGLLTVTNTYANKDAEALTALSSNLIPVAPSIDGIAAGLARAIGAAGDLERRVAGSRVVWSTRWSESFDDALLARITTFLEEA